MNRQEERSLLDTVRWMSAFLVAFGHAAGLVFVKDDSSSSRVMWYIADMRGSWVLLFFVLSGYLIGGNFLLNLNDFNFRRYFIARFSRIYIVLIPALILVMLLDGIAYFLDADNPVYGSPWPNGVLGTVSLFGKYSWEDVLASFFSLESVLGEPIGSGGALWSLGLEWAFYFSFPTLVIGAVILARALCFSDAASVAITITISVVLLIVLHKFFVALFWLIWVAGAVAHFVAKTKNISLRVRQFGLAICVVGLVCSPLINSRIASPMIGFGFAMFLSRFPIREHGFFRSIDKILAEFSYSLYVVHLPILTFLTFFIWKIGILPFGGLPVGVKSVLLLFSMLGLCVAISFMFGRFFEKRTDMMRKTLMRRTENWKNFLFDGKIQE